MASASVMSSTSNGISVPRRYSSRPIPKRGRVKLLIAVAIVNRLASMLTIHLRSSRATATFGTPTITISAIDLKVILKAIVGQRWAKQGQD
ncbi:hypothetical protein CRG98_018048 [Punica granatum]|uniref:Uncharacterized protein n=1 Tax=Punica granatum TaxID=22663 RepID=A0A2I0JZ74_PUNGR|nr:hypothetical protein CRG98_018048 [Punica granatum]